MEPFGGAVRRLVVNRTKGWQLGILGSPRVPVLELNLPMGALWFSPTLALGQIVGAFQH